MRYLWIVLLLIYSTENLAGTIHPSVPDKKYVDYAAKYNCVAKLLTKKNNRITSCSSCVFINDQWVLTAAHIFEKKDSHDTYVSFENKDVLISKVIVHKDFDPNNVGFYDIALCKLSSPIKHDINFPQLYSEKNETKKIADIVGWGVTGTFDKGGYLDDSKQRGGTNRISQIDKHVLMCDASRHDNGSPLEFLISHGDSGGALFIDKKLAGINSLVFASDGKPDSTWTDESGHTRISLFIDWINETMAAY